MRRTIAAALILLCGAGCSTIRTFNTGDHLWLYSGTRQNLAVWTPGNRIHDCSGMIGCVTVTDFPWSFALDTIAIPVTLPLELFGGGKEE